VAISSEVIGQICFPIHPVSMDSGCYGDRTGSAAAPRLQVRVLDREETDGPEDLASQLRCSLCDGDFALVSHYHTSRKGSHWAYELAATFREVALSAPSDGGIGRDLQSSGGSAGHTHVLGLEVHTPSWDCELTSPLPSSTARDGCGCG